MVSYRLGDLRWPDLAERSPILAVPTGSCEQHGRHLPVDTDTVIACAFAQALAQSRDDVVVAPPVSIGASGEHRGFPATLSIGTEAMRDVAVEIARSALPEPADAGAWAGFGGVLFVNGHGGNLEALEAAVSTLRGEGRRVAAWHPRVPDGDPHAGRTETSMMLHLAPDRVRMELAEPGPGTRFSEIGDVLRTDGLAAVAPNGVLGDPTAATAEHGKVLFEGLVADLLSAAAAVEG
ncbi:MAG: mycofactocin biosynthesis peptidyl-dipeptidase MftE [Actinomycetia bacterium]|jgi:creatinine amidohydrolase|nr:mycofactocin biosynthesis peptidyl-dipeptidase MftE [Actinomycetes bacterium]